MKRTGRTLTLTNAVTNIAPPGSISNLGYRLSTIFQDDREGYGWKVTKLEWFSHGWIRLSSGWSLMTTQPDTFTNAVEFGVWAAGKSIFSNQLIGMVGWNLNNQLGWKSLKADHVAVNHLSLLYEDGDLPYYNIELEEYQISDREEIMFRIKEIGQSLNEIGE